MDLSDIELQCRCGFAEVRGFAMQQITYLSGFLTYVMNCKLSLIVEPLHSRWALHHCLNTGRSGISVRSQPCKLRSSEIVCAWKDGLRDQKVHHQVRDLWARGLFTDLSRPSPSGDYYVLIGVFLVTFTLVVTMRLMSFLTESTCSSMIKQDLMES